MEAFQQPKSLRSNLANKIDYIHTHTRSNYQFASLAYNPSLKKKSTFSLLIHFPVHSVKTYVGSYNAIICCCVSQDFSTCSSNSLTSLLSLITINKPRARSRGCVVDVREPQVCNIILPARRYVEAPCITRFSLVLRNFRTSKYG